jgi:colicin import membrane protein
VFQLKAIKDAKKKAEEEAEAAAAAEALQKRREEREAKKKARAEARAAEVAAAKAAAEARVMADPWTQAQQVAFEAALLTFTAHLERNERWAKVAAAVPTAPGCEAKSKNQCLARYRFLKEYVAQKLKMEAAAKADT